MPYGRKSGTSETLDGALTAHLPHRSWVPRGTDPDLSDRGFLFDPESPPYPTSGFLFDPSEYSIPEQVRPPEVQLPLLVDFPVLGLLGAHGMGKTTSLRREHSDLIQAGHQTLFVDLAACGTDVCREIFQSRELTSWRNQNRRERFYLLLAHLETGLQRVDNLVARLIENFGRQPREQLWLRIACRSTEWPLDLEDGLRRLWGEQQVGIFELAPLRRNEARAIVEEHGLSGEEFLEEVACKDAARFANRPRTLELLIEIFRKNQGLPTDGDDLYWKVCRALCDEWRPDLRRSTRSQRLSSGLRFRIACRIAAVSIFCRRTAVSIASHHELTHEGDVRVEELLGEEERFGGEVTSVGEPEILETLHTGLFHCIGRGRVGFVDRTHAEFLAAQYVIEPSLPVSDLLQLILRPNGSRVLRELRGTAVWLASLRAELFMAILTIDPIALFASDISFARDTAPLSEEYRLTFKHKILPLYHSRFVFDVVVVPGFPERSEILIRLESGQTDQSSRLEFMRRWLDLARDPNQPDEVRADAAWIYNFGISALKTLQRCTGNHESSEELTEVTFAEPRLQEIMLDMAVDDATGGNIWEPCSPSYLIDQVTNPPSLKVERYLRTSTNPQDPEVRGTPQETNGDVPTVASRSESPAEENRPMTPPVPVRKRQRRQNDKIAKIDEALRKIAEAEPKSHREVFRFLDERKVNIPNSEPFKTAGGWLKGSDADWLRAAGWLSKAWNRLGLPPFPPGPKKSKK